MIVDVYVQVVIGVGFVVFVFFVGDVDVVSEGQVVIDNYQFVVCVQVQLWVFEWFQQLSWVELDCFIVGFEQGLQEMVGQGG